MQSKSTWTASQRWWNQTLLQSYTPYDKGKWPQIGKRDVQMGLGKASFLEGWCCNGTGYMNRLRNLHPWCSLHSTRQSCGWPSLVREIIFFWTGGWTKWSLDNSFKQNFYDYDFPRLLAKGRWPDWKLVWLNLVMKHVLLKLLYFKDAGGQLHHIEEDLLSSGKFATAQS